MKSRSEKFIQYYWRQVAPYPARPPPAFCTQNTGKQAAVVNLLHAARGKHGDSLIAIMMQPAAWKGLRAELSSIVRITSLEAPDRRAVAP